MPLATARRIWTGLLVAAGLAVVHACAGSPTSASCSYTVSPASLPVTGIGGIFQATMATAQTCQWSASESVSWITLETPRGTGPGPVVFHVAANDGTGMRAAALQVQGQGIEIRQEASSCSVVAVSPAAVSFGATGGAAPLAVTAPDGCRWTANTSDAWIALAGAAGDGNGPMLVSVGPNTGANTRTGSLRVGNQSVSVTQAGAGCDFDVAPTSRTVGPGGESFSVAVDTLPGCEWRADANDGWLAVSASRGTGPGRVTVDVAAHTGTGSRTGTLRIGGHTISVTQSGTPADTPCAYSLSTHAQPAPAAGGAFSVNVMTTSGCSWTATSSAGWVTVTAGDSGTGSGLVSYSVAANPTTTDRTATLQIADETLTISQPGAPVPCSYTLSPTDQSVPASGGTFQFTIATTASCQWTATSADSWVTLREGSGTGSTTVTYAVAPNQSTTTRTSTIQAGGRTLAITQAGVSCSFVLDTTQQNVPANGGSYRVNVKTASACGWTASSNAPWLTITAGSKGSGPGTVSYTVSANPSKVRSGTLTVAGQTVTVNQAGSSTIP